MVTTTLMVSRSWRAAAVGAACITVVNMATEANANTALSPTSSVSEATGTHQLSAAQPAMIMPIARFCQRYPKACARVVANPCVRFAAACKRAREFAEEQRKRIVEKTNDLVDRIAKEWEDLTRRRNVPSDDRINQLDAAIQELTNQHRALVAGHGALDERVKGAAKELKRLREALKAANNKPRRLGRTGGGAVPTTKKAAARPTAIAPRASDFDADAVLRGPHVR